MQADAQPQVPPTPKQPLTAEQAAQVQAAQALLAQAQLQANAVAEAQSKANPAAGTNPLEMSVQGKMKHELTLDLSNLVEQYGLTGGVEGIPLEFLESPDSAAGLLAAGAGAAGVSASGDVAGAGAALSDVNALGPMGQKALTDAELF